MGDKPVRVILSAITSGYSAGMQQAAADTTRLAAVAAKARQQQEAAVRRLEIAEKRLAELQASGKARQSSLLAAEEGVRKARENLATATAKVAVAEKQLTDSRQYLEDHAQQLGRIGTNLMLVGAAAAAGIGLAVSKFADFDQGMSEVAATGEDARGSIDMLREAAIKAGADTKYSATEAAGGIENLAKAGMSASNILGGGLAGALDLAAAGQMSVANAAETTAVTLAQFELSGSDAAHVADLLAAGAGKAVGEVSDMGQALKMSGTVAHQYGVSIEETVGTLALFAQNALGGSDAGTSFKQMLLQLASPTDEASALLKQYNIHAYDTQGRFVGMASLADQLKTNLGGLAQEQQNAALKTIFGADAIRSANILMREGGEGVRKWTADVNDQGYAAEVAAIKMNNLKGDLEQLGGSWETLLIRTGEGANGPLRAGVQTLTNMVNAATEGGPAFQTAALAIAGVTAVVGLLGGGLLKGVSGLAQFKMGLIDLGVKAETASTAVSRLTMAAGLIGAGLTVATLIFAGWANEQAKAKAKTDELTASLDRQTGAVTENTARIAADQLQKSAAAETAAKLGLSLTDITSAALGNADAMARVDKASADYLATMQQYDSGTIYADEFSNAKDKVNELSGALEKIRGPIVENQNNIRQSAAAARDASLATSGLKTDTTGLGFAAQNAAKETKSYNDALREAANAALQASGSAMGLESAIDAGTKALTKETLALAKKGEALNIDTELGRENRKTLDTIASASLSLQKAQEAQGASTETLNASTKRARDSFIDTATKMGMTKQAANELADRYGLIPKTVVTSVTLDGASGAVSAINGLIQKVNTLDGRVVTIRTNVVGTDVSYSLNGRIARAGGGPVWGAGTSTSDSIPARLSNGEFVHQAAAVSYYGLDFMDAVNRLRVPKHVFASLGFSGGGPVHYSDAPRFSTGGLATTSGPQVVVSQPSGPAIVHVYGAGDVLLGTFRGMLDSALTSGQVAASAGVR